MRYGKLGEQQKRVLFGFMKKDDVLAYPTLISNMNHTYISRPTAISACKSLKSKGILKKKKRDIVGAGTTTIIIWIGT